MICFYSNIGCFESTVIFKWRNNKTNNNNKKTRGKRSHLVYFIQSQSELSQNETNAYGMRRSLHRTFFRPERPTLTSRSLQSITRPFQKRFREVFGNARILIFYLSIKAWEEKSLPNSHLGWFFLVFVKVKRQKKTCQFFGSFDL